MRKPETPEEKLAAKVAALFALLGTDNAGEHENARKLLNDLLSRHRKSWNAVPELLRIASTLDDRGVQDDPDDERSRAAALIAIADSFSLFWGKAARDAAVAFSKGYRDEDIAVVLLANIRTLFNARGVDRFASADLVAGLTSMDDGPWAEWRGARDDQNPRRLSPGELARLLAPFGIRPKSIWPRRRHDAGKGSSKGYSRGQFEAPWRSYLNEAGTAAQPQDIRHLRAL
jgi:Protein of unknown function (DUF3631)